MAVAPTKISLKLLVNKHTNNVLFAEAGKDFVDFLFSLLVLPVGTVINILTQQNMVAVGGLGQLYQSLVLLNPTHMQSEGNKNLLLSPPVPSSISPPSSLLQIPNQSDARSISHYRCDCPSLTYTDAIGSRCPLCRKQMISKMKLIGNTTATVAPPVKEGYVRELITYMVMDDLSVSSMSTISSITLLNKFQVKDVGVLEERIVSVGMDEGIKILKTSLQSSTVLSDVFLVKKIAKSECKPEKHQPKPAKRQPKPAKRQRTK